MGSVVFLKISIRQLTRIRLFALFKEYYLYTTSVSGFAEREIILHFISKGRKEE